MRPTTRTSRALPTNRDLSRSSQHNETKEQRRVAVEVEEVQHASRYRCWTATKSAPTGAEVRPKRDRHKRGEKQPLWCQNRVARYVSGVMAHKHSHVPNVQGEVCMAREWWWWWGSRTFALVWCGVSDTFAKKKKYSGKSPPCSGPSTHQHRINKQHPETLSKAHQEPG